MRGTPGPLQRRSPRDCAGALLIGAAYLQRLFLATVRGGAWPGRLYHAPRPLRHSFVPPPRERLRTPAVAGTTGERLVDHIAASRILPARAKGLLIHANRGDGSWPGDGRLARATLRQAFVHPSTVGERQRQQLGTPDERPWSFRRAPGRRHLLKLRGPTENFTRRGEGP